MLKSLLKQRRKCTFAIMGALVCLNGCCGHAEAEGFRDSVTRLIQSSCIDCHDSDTETGLNFDELTFDLSQTKQFRQWEQVFDRVSNGEMPPSSEPKPSDELLKSVTETLRDTLHVASLQKQQSQGRVTARRLTKVEFGYTLQDLLLVNEDVTSGIPDETESGSFDTVGETQRISAVHMESYLRAADRALDLGMRLGANPRKSSSNDYGWLEAWHNKPLSLGGSVTKKLESGDGIVLFRDIDYLTHFQFHGFGPYSQTATSGIHRLTADVATYQSTQPLTAKIIVKDGSGAARLVHAADVIPGDRQTISVETHLKPGDVAYLTFVNPEPNAIFTAGGATHYQGPGLAIYSQKVDGPLLESWPSPSARSLLHGLELAPESSFLGGLLDGSSNSNPSYEVRPSKDDREHVAEIIGHFAQRALRRPAGQEEIQAFVDLANQAIEEKRPILKTVRIPMRSMLASPQFLLFEAKPGKLDDYALANRLSYFLWKSMPDEELFRLAKMGQLSTPEVLAEQVERMLGDKKVNRFIDDFLGQWLLLHKVNATTPDDGLYPEFDELLANSIPQETPLFFAELIQNNLSASNLINSDFAMLNRRLAEHYGIEGVTGQEFRRVALPTDSLRGGLLTQAAILKTTANGTNTSPVMRGGFVLTNFLGTPPSPPPPNVGSIEPDTRGKTTIREILAAHRRIESCNQCHRQIDPPGFAMESFDPIGGFRTHYRISSGEQNFDGNTIKLPPKDGLPVDPSGTTADGQDFESMSEFKQHLMNQKEQVVRNLISRLVVYATGAEIQFADREVVDEILEQLRDSEFPVRDIIHAVVECRLFLNQ